MKKLLIAAVVGALSSTMMLAATDAAAQGQTTTKKTVKKAVARKPAPKHRLLKRREHTAKEAKADPILAGSDHWSCAEGLSFDMKGDMSRDRIVTVHWANKNYSLPREITTTGADRFHDAATGLDLVVIPTKAMLFQDKDSSRLADECKTAAMEQGALAPTQSAALRAPAATPTSASAVAGQ